MSVDIRLYMTMEMGHLSGPMTHGLHEPLYHFILRMGLGGGVAIMVVPELDNLSVLRAKNIVD